MASLGPGSVASYNIAPGQSQADLDLKRKIAQQMMLEGMSVAPVQSWTQGLARALQAGMGAFDLYQADKEDQADRAKTRQIIGALMGGNPTASPTPAPTGATQPTAAAPSDNYGNAIAGIESGGKYDALGPVTKSGDRAYGKYQIMGANVGPWTKQYLGQEMTPDQFLASKEAQDKIFNGQFGSYVNKYGPEGAARAWFAGEGGMNNPAATDQLGTSVQQYGQKFAQAMPQVAPAAPAPAPAPMPAPVQGAPVGAPVNEARGGLETNRRAQLIQALSTTKAGAPYAQAMLAKQLEQEANRVRPLTDQEKALYQGAVAIDANGKPIFPPPSTNVSVNSVANPIMAGISKQFDESRDQANKAVDSINITHQMRRQIDDGMFTGPFANWQTGAVKVADAIGLPMSQDSLNKMANSESFVSTAANLVKTKIKAFGSGSGITDADRDYTQAMVGGSVKLNEESMRRILDINEKLDRYAIAKHNAMAEKLLSNKDTSRELGQFSPLLKIDAPSEYAAPEKKQTAAPFTPPATWQFSPSRKQYRDAQGNLYDINGQPVK